MSEIKVGSVVELKSGGPDMTVYKIDGPQASVVWMEHGASEIRFGMAPLVALHLSISDPDHADNQEDETVSAG